MLGLPIFKKKDNESGSQVQGQNASDNEVTADPAVPQAQGSAMSPIPGAVQAVAPASDVNVQNNINNSKLEPSNSLNNSQNASDASQEIKDVGSYEESEPEIIEIKNDQSGFSSSDDDLSTSGEIKILEDKIKKANLPKEIHARVSAMIGRLKKMTKGDSYSREFEPVSEYINWVVQIPYGRYTKDDLAIDNAIKTLDAHHYGLKQVKDRLLEYLAILNLQSKTGHNSDGSNNAEVDMSKEMMRLQGNSSHAPILCFVGIQGVGKTTMAKSIAGALNRKFVRVSLGAVGSVTEIRGRSRGEVDAEPGQIVKSLIRTGVMNPLILLDEIDKTSSATGLRADLMAALLEILDPEQNSTFMDKYIDFPIDLSQCIFITTANNLGGISAALLDRLEVVRFSSYNDDEKTHIARDYLLPKVRQATGLTEEQLSFDDEIWPLVIRPLGFDAGVRQLERTLMDLARKVAFQIVKGTTKGVRISPSNFREYIPEQIGILS